MINSQESKSTIELLYMGQRRKDLKSYLGEKTKIASVKYDRNNFLEIEED